MNKNYFSPFKPEQLENFTSLVENFSPEQLIWASGYLAGVNSLKPQINQVEQASILHTHAHSPANKTSAELTILYGSRTGNGANVAKTAQKIAIENGFSVNLKNMENYKIRDLKLEQNLMLIVSTHGEGEPPFAARELYDFLHSKRATKLENLHFTVLALGDRSYFHFCKTGKDFDKKLAELGASRIFERCDCDVDFNEQAVNWVKNALQHFEKPATTKANSILLKETSNQAVSEIKYSKKNPYQAKVLDKINLHGRDSDRQTLHIELSIENSGIQYSPGDSVGVFPTNCPDLVNDVLKISGLKAEDEVTIDSAKVSLYEALFRHFELSNLTADVVSRYAEATENLQLKELLTKHNELKLFLEETDIETLLEKYPAKLNAEQFVKILRKLQPRLYSISSSQAAHPDELHITVGLLQFERNKKLRKGTCTGFLSSKILDNEFVPIFIEKNSNFKLPDDNNTAMIMIGAGTGIAPYRSFIEEREVQEATGKNWLFFGNRNFESEFLYQTEWNRFMKAGVLHKMNVAFSRDTDEKIYVQHKLQQNSSEIFKWLEDGANLYICGDMKKMATDVHKTLINIIMKEGQRTEELALEYINNLQRQKRYQTDVY